MRAINRFVAPALLLWAGVTMAQSLPAFEISIRQGRIEPSRLEVPAGVKIKLSLHNEGPGPCEFENLELRVEKVLAPGARSFVVIHPLRPGTYRFIDEFHPATAAMELVAR